MNIFFAKSHLAEYLNKIDVVSHTEANEKENYKLTQG
jgi:hypothetical protein